MLIRNILLSSVALMALPSVSYAQEAPQATAADAAAKDADVIIVTGTAGGSKLRKQDASFAITSISAADVERAQPKSTAELFSLVPGVWAESSGGVAGANIDVRGLPGGGDAPFVTISINGAPIYGTDKLSFMEQSSIFRTDDTIGSTEALRGGPNAVFSKGEPGVTLNSRLKEGGETTEGRLKFSTSDYNLLRVDGRLSGKIADGLYYMVGGYVSTSPGIRNAQFNSEKGSQFTAQLTKTFDAGKVNIWTRVTDDHGQWYLPMALFSGNDAGTFSQLGNATRYANLQVSPTGFKNYDLANGRGWKGSVSGLNADIDVSDNITLRDNLSYTKGNANTYGFVPDGAAIKVSALPGGTATTLGGTILSGSAYVQNYGAWVVEKDLQSLTNDLSLEAKLGDHKITLGYYGANWSSNDFWSLGNFRPVQNIANGDYLSAATTCATLQTAGSGSGCWHYGIASQGDARVNALYLADSFQITEALRFDAGVRKEWWNLNYSVDSGPGYPDGTRDLAKTLSASKVAYTGALNYTVSHDLGLFARYSSGFRFPDFDDVRGGALNVFGVKQTEVGVKYTGENISMFATGFYNTNDSFNSVVGGASSLFKTRSYGVELDGNLHFGDFRLGVIGTLQDAKITASSTASEVGHKVLRQPAMQFRISPSYDFETSGGLKATLYGAVTPVGKRYNDNSNVIVLAGYTKVDLGLTVNAPSGFFGEVHVDNLTNSHGLTEGDPRIPASANGRPILGRSVKFSVGYKF